MNAYKIDHIGVAVASIDDALAIYRALGLEEKHREEVPSQKVLTAFLPAGESRIELLQPTAEDSPVAKFLAKRGQGIHHICFGVRDIEASVAELQRRGFRLINSRPAPGADGKKIVFLHPDSGNGVLIELSQEAGAAPP
ncbi:MAG TPA: methylmalonyl-CoA epimerase [Thermoanaerobaculia bacterium]|jgi:methylmalonyl-CoA/ethylmalonyl-CoA epimerase|nr:methylmalonyl-CoA epimerase [Thermoanaerobaculia bacterium]